LSAAHDLLRGAFDVLVGPLDRLAPGAGLWVVSALAGIALLWAFRWSSNPAAIRTARSRAQAELLAVRLYRDSPRVVLRAQGSFLAALGRYLGHMLVPFAVLAVPFGLVAAQLDGRYGAEPVAVGDRVVVEVAGSPALLESARLESRDDGVVVESGPVRIAGRGEMSWRILARSPGLHAVSVVVGETRIDKTVAVATSETAAPRRMSAGIPSFFLAPAEAAIDEAAPVRSIEVRYPRRVGWLVVFLAVSGIVALALRRRMGVEF